MAFDAAGREAVEPWVTTGPKTMAPEYRAMITWWDDQTFNRGGPATYPCLIDREHRVAELYDMVNVPTAVWIDERGRIVRPAEPAGFNDAFRMEGYDRTTLETDPNAGLTALHTRTVYVNGLRDWVEKGDASPYIFSPEEVQRRLKGPDPDHALAAAHARLGAFLRTRGESDPAERHFREAVRLRPESWEYYRQSLVLAESRTGTFAADEEWWARVESLGDTPYFPPIEMEGM